MASRVCVDCAGQTQAVVGIENIFEVILPQPALAAPTGTITISNAESQLVFSGQAPLAITASGPGRRSLELSSAPTNPLAGRQGTAWVVSDSIVWPCQVVSFETSSAGTVANLAAALPYALPAGVSAQLVFGYYAAVLPVRNAPVARCPIRVTYQPVARVGQPVATLEFQCRYVRQIFETGLTCQQLRAFLSGGPSVPSSDAGLEPAVSAGLDDLVRFIRTELSEKGLDETDVPAPRALRDAHQLFAAAHVYAVTNRELHDAFWTDARYSAGDTLRHLWVDKNGDGRWDAGDTDNITGKRSRDFRFELPRPKFNPILRRFWR